MRTFREIVESLPHHSEWVKFATIDKESGYLSIEFTKPLRSGTTGYKIPFGHLNGSSELDEPIFRLLNPDFEQKTIERLVKYVESLASEGT